MSNPIIQTSRRLYSHLVNFYPKRYRQEFGEEMKYVFSESLKDAYSESSEHGIFTVWVRTIIDALNSLVTQHVENIKRSESMKAKNNDLIMQNKVFGLVALVTGLLLSLPYMAMQFNWQVPDPGSSISSGVNWTLGDFIVMGSLLFISGSVFVLVARKFPKNRVVVGIIVAIAFLWLWAELAVGVFTNWGS